MNHSFYSIDRTTHAKIVVVALICATAVGGISIAAHLRGDSLQVQHVSIIKAGKPAMVASDAEVAVR
jgi:hypothetical protein